MVTYVCSAHGKKRNEDALQADGAGGWECIPGRECQVGGRGGSLSSSNEIVRCSAHGKNRSEKNCVPDGRGGMRCSPKHLCIGADAADSADVGNNWHEESAKMMGNMMAMMT